MVIIGERKEYKFGPFHFILTDEDLVFESEGEEIRLVDETGWWDEAGTIYVYTPEIRRLRQVGIGTHEFVERVLMQRLKMPTNWAHRVSNILEYLISLGTAEIYWR